MKTNQPVYLNQAPFQQGDGGFLRQPFPNNYSGFGFGNPYSSFFPSPSAVPASSTSSGFNFNQIKEVIDRLGGIEGIMANISKVQGFIKNIQQMAPMLKLLMSSFGAKAATTGTNSRLDGLHRPIRKRKRRRVNYGLKKTNRFQKR